ncbi:alginate lyase family protein [Neorhodopirellula lusitana]|uniref:alginate lyase family protein n=1 Tax=Neorhodopirellula lusitana TaxID=445327 RepID=UPI00384B9AD2
MCLPDLNEVMILYQMRIVVFLLLLTSVNGAIALGQFAHPGVAHSLESIAFARGNVEAGEQPWLSAWEGVSNSRYASLEYQARPSSRVERGPYNNPDIGSSEFSDDAKAAYYHSLCWAFSGEEAHAVKAAEVINAWSGTLRSVGNHDARLLIGMSGYHFCVAAELLKHTWDQWPEDEQSRFESMLRDIWYPVIEDFHPTANGNWDASMLQVMIAMAVFLDDQKMFDKATDYYLSGNGNGAIGKYFMESGQCQESGRDQAHTQMGLEFLANTCETAWIQGVDLYGALDNRLLKGFEYTAKYNLGFDVPYQPYRSVEGRYFYETLSRDSRGRLRPMYERVLNHYQNRQGLKATYTEQAALKLRMNQPEGRVDRDGSRRGGRREGRRGRGRSTPSHLDTLMYAGRSSSVQGTTE